MSFFLFQLTLLAYFVTSAAYIIFFIGQRPQIRKTARLLFLGAGVLHSLTILARYLDAGHTPITNHHETISFFAWSVTWCYLSFRWRYTVKNFGTFTSLFATLLLLIAAFMSRKTLPLPPALQSWWLPVHAAGSLLSYGFFSLAFLGGIMYLLQEHELKSKRFGLFFSRLPSLDALDQLNHHCLTIGFLFLTFGIITGSVWAKQAWGAYWQWDPKETWSLITWFFYAALVHQRMIVGSRGHRVAQMTVLCFLSVLFTLWGVTYLLGGQHSYVG